MGADIVQTHSGLTLYNNEMYGLTTSNPGINHQDGIQAGNAHHLKIYNNYIHDCGNAWFSWDRDSSFAQSNDGYLIVYNNVFADTVNTGGANQGLSSYFWGSNVYDVIIANNTFVSIRALAFNISSNGTWHNSIFQNNIFVNCNHSGGAGSVLGNIGKSSGGGTSGITASNNIATQAGTIIQVHGVNNAGAVLSTGLPTFVSYTPFSGSNDLHLQATDTVAKGQGVSLSSYFNHDKDGYIRTGTWDIGAYEYNVGSPQPPVDQLLSGNGGGGGCFIATAAYGSYLDPHVYVLRNFRDRYLLTSSLGQAFVNSYYRYSPPVADFIRKHETLKTAVRWTLTPVVCWVEYPYTGASILLIIPAGIILALRRRKVKRYH
jgi:hypothetical protein